MILHPSILALLVSSLLIGAMVLYSAVYGIQILRWWDITSGSERQLSLERKTYLISTILAYFLGFQVISLFLFVFTADSICTLFVGAMCAVGTLTANGLGYSVLLCKLVTCILAGLWLILNYADNKGYDYPLIKAKYRFLVVLTPLIIGEVALQGAYFLNLTPDIITSCCGSLFSSTRENIAAEIAALPSMPMKVVFYATVLLTLAAGVLFLLRGTMGWLFSALSGMTFVVSVISLISVISLYIYQLPTHHCPFCILQSEYGHIGYPLYITLLGGVVTGLGTGVLMPFRTVESLSGTLPGFQRKLALASILFYLLFTLIATWPMVFSSFRLDG